MALRLVSTKTTKINIGEEDWIEVKSDLSRRDFNRIIGTLPVTREGLDTDAIDLDTAVGFAEALFDVFVKGWSVQDDNGKAVKATVDNYQMLSRESSSEIDSALSDHFNSMGIGDEEAQKSA